MSLATLRVDQVGSLLRPERLKQAFFDHGQGKIDRAELTGLEDEAISALVAKQQAHGLPVVTDGEYRRLNWQVSFSQVDGWDMWDVSWKAFLNSPAGLGEDEKPMSRGEDAVVTYAVPATDRLTLTRNFPLAEYQYLASVASRPAKAMLMGPDRVAQMCDIPGSPAYDSADAFLDDVVAIQREIVTGLVEAGCPYIQLDEPSYTGYVDPATLKRLETRGEDPLARLERAVAADNAVIEGMAGKATFGLHICRGNRASMWHREGSYDAIAEILFGGLTFDRLLLEYDSDRAGGFEPLVHVPRGQDGRRPIVVLGLITTKSGDLETTDDLLRRIEDAERFIPIDQLALSPQCGFASGIGGNLLSEDQQWRKLDRMLEVADKVWGRLD